MKIIVYVPATNAQGSPEIVRAEVTTTEAAYSGGLHYDQALVQVQDAGYETGSPCFDENDIGGHRHHWDAIAATID